MRDENAVDVTKLLQRNVGVLPLIRKRSEADNRSERLQLICQSYKDRQLDSVASFLKSVAAVIRTRTIQATQVTRMIKGSIPP